MNLLSHEFSRREKLLLLILILLLGAFSYYQFFYRPIRREIEDSHNARDGYRAELAEAQERIKQLKQMQEELNNLGKIGFTSRMPSYNGSEEEIDFLNRVLASAIQYSISFANVTRDGEQIRRNFSLSFTAAGFTEAEAILSALTSGDSRCLLGDLSFSASESDGTVSLGVTATFFETMSGGTPDAGLPDTEE